MKVTNYQGGFGMASMKPENATVVGVGGRLVQFDNAELEFLNSIKSLSKKQKDMIIVEFAKLIANAS